MFEFPNDTHGRFALYKKDRCQKGHHGQEHGQKVRSSHPSTLDLVTAFCLSAWHILATVVCWRRGERLCRDECVLVSGLSKVEAGGQGMEVVGLDHPRRSNIPPPGNPVNLRQKRYTILLILNLRVRESVIKCQCSDRTRERRVSYLAPRQRAPCLRKEPEGWPAWPIAEDTGQQAGERRVPA